MRIFFFSVRINQNYPYKYSCSDELYRSTSKVVRNMASSSSDIKEQSKCFSVVSLQELVKEPILTIPHHYVHLDINQPPPPDHPNPMQPMITPTIDMAQLVSGADDDAELNKLHSICKDWGLFQVKYLILLNSPLAI